MGFIREHSTSPATDAHSFITGVVLPYLNAETNITLDINRMLDDLT